MNDCVQGGIADTLTQRLSVHALSAPPDSWHASPGFGETTRRVVASGPASVLPALGLIVDGPVKTGIRAFFV